MSNVVIVTGGTGSIGTAICEEFEKRGLIAVAADMAAASVPGNRAFVACDLTKPEDVHRLFDEAAKLGTLTCVVIAHGILAETPAGQADLATVGRVIDINLKSAAFACEVASQRVADNGAILMISSATAFLGRIRNAFAYQASKGGMEAMTKAMAIACAARGIRVNAIAPGFVSVTMKGGEELRRRQGGDEAASKLVPLGRLVSPQDVARGTAFLCSSDAALITGEILHIDGGLSAF